MLIVLFSLHNNTSLPFPESQLNRKHHFGHSHPWQLTLWEPGKCLYTTTTYWNSVGTQTGHVTPETCRLGWAAWAALPSGGCCCGTALKSGTHPHPVHQSQQPRDPKRQKKQDGQRSWRCWMTQRKNRKRREEMRSQAEEWCKGQIWRTQRINMSRVTIHTTDVNKLRMSCFTCVYLCGWGLRAVLWQRQWQQGYIGVYFLSKAEAVQETTEAHCHSAAPEMSNTLERHLARISVSNT